MYIKKYISSRSFLTFVVFQILFFFFLQIWKTLQMTLVYHFGIHQCIPMIYYTQTSYKYISFLINKSQNQNTHTHMILCTQLHVIAKKLFAYQNFFFYARGTKQETFTDFCNFFFLSLDSQRTTFFSIRFSQRKMIFSSFKLFSRSSCGF